MVTVYLGLGSNLSDRETSLQEAIARLNQNSVTVKKVSTIIETDPIGGPAQGKFLNAVLEAETDLPPLDLLNLTQKIEKQLGRKRTIPNGPRTIDIDILLYGNRTIHTPELIVPHPRMFERDFVLKPLYEIAPHLTLEPNHAHH
ncbi:MAG TPA: 2-amino-4-hydroxy-6-hydroxymethyldihydropteridine diphosphokinase [Candidatus Omnitrophota bacterium]|nr:2-amino-4-hydroxy-6-hydroxymethyldihydropteridine diphosphokinase [Candidatus Omnitrophota bacterium]HPD85329.1 2-amino-4-hydroxy-6-hydroxymethyldihydropteridine diphosphokinase [Candidatus Omnitrophota bacterium]HRZ04170.1 2-amino-4-hydroxy-6-hydroxymethyldihydropteridine diphosphokinase [Candidatus Omnitrophota bacterium]